MTGHNADDMAETVMMNLLRGDLPRLARSTSIVTASAASEIKRSKPLKYAYEKEIVLYAHHKRLDYFSTECVYSPEAFRGSARTLIKNLERVRPSAILDVVRSGEDMARLVPVEVGGLAGCAGRGAAAGAGDDGEEEGDGGCGSANGRSSGGEMVEMERRLVGDEVAEGREVEVTSPRPGSQPHDRIEEKSKSGKVSNKKPSGRLGRKLPKQQMGQCTRCGYLSSQEICKACMLLEGLNKNRPKMEIELGSEGKDMTALRSNVEGLALNGG